MIRYLCALNCDDVVAGNPNALSLPPSDQRQVSSYAIRIILPGHIIALWGRCNSGMSHLISLIPTGIFMCRDYEYYIVLIYSLLSGPFSTLFTSVL